MKATELPGLNVLRVFAALYMVMFHLHPSFLPEPVAVFFSRGTSDTSLFFLLSGFLLAHLYAGRRMDEAGQRRFVWRRVARIFPANLIGLVFLLVAQSLLGHGGADWKTLTECLFLVQTWVVGSEHALNIPAWSMSCLLFFYLIFPVVLPRLERLKSETLQVAMLALWILSAVVLPELARWPGGLDPSAWVQHLHTSPLLRSTEFMLGMGMAVLVSRRAAPPVWWFGLVVPLTLGLLFFAPGETMAINNGLFAPLTVSLLLAFVNPGPLVARLGASRPMRSLASASICIFLLHMTWIQVFNSWLLPKLNLEWNIGTLALFIAVLLGSAVAVDGWVCQPVSRLLTGRAVRGGRPAPARGNLPALNAQPS
ncbi:acyltransferase family protein [Deinococcus sp.]|uniref:acyltransferase family protein n=1 Tax=Deinococcus sp. TaxID=47478 RepID=UPI003C7E6AC4